MTRQCIRVTIHHCFFDGTRQRQPRLRFGKVHLYNNYTRNWGIYAVCASVESQVNGIQFSLQHLNYYSFGMIIALIAFLWIYNYCIISLCDLFLSDILSMQYIWSRTEEKDFWILYREGNVTWQSLNLFFPFYRTLKFQMNILIWVIIPTCHKFIQKQSKLFAIERSIEIGWDTSKNKYYKMQLVLRKPFPILRARDIICCTQNLNLQNLIIALSFVNLCLIFTLLMSKAVWIV